MLLKTESLTKLYGTHKALDSLSMSVSEGSVCGFIGPNGAGKTTAMRIIVTLMRATAGEVFVNDVPVSYDLTGVRKNIGYVPDFFGVYAAMTSEEYLNFYADINRVPTKGRDALIDSMLSLVNLTDKKYADVNQLSRGMKQRLCLARALLHNPKLLVLDEPASGLDAQSRAELKTILSSLRSTGKGILISSHILPELGEICDSVVILNKGRKVAEGTIEDISKQIGEKQKITYTLVNENQFDDAVSILRMNPAVGEIIRDKMNLEVEFNGTEEESSALLRRLMMADIMIAGVNKTKLSLEQLFLEVIENDSN